MSDPPKTSKQTQLTAKYIDKVKSAILNNQVIDGTGRMDPMPPRNKVRDEFKRPPFNILDRTSFRVIKVEDLGDYKIYIQIPGEKTEYDFLVWRAIFRSDNLIDLKIPTHDDLGKMYLDLKNLNSILDEYLINAVLRLIRDRLPLNNVINHYFKDLNQNLLNEVKKFLLTLKWIALQEDINYPPPNLGSLYALSVYAVLEVTKDLSAIRKIIRFKA